MLFFWTFFSSKVDTWGVTRNEERDYFYHKHCFYCQISNHIFFIDFQPNCANDFHQILLLVFDIMFQNIETCLHVSTEPFKIRNYMLYYMVFNAVFQMYVIKILCILRQKDMTLPCLIYHALYRWYRARQRRVVFKYKWQMRI